MKRTQFHIVKGSNSEAPSCKRIGKTPPGKILSFYLRLRRDEHAADPQKVHEEVCIHHTRAPIGAEQVDTLFDVSGNTMQRAIQGATKYGFTVIGYYPVLRLLEVQATAETVQRCA